MAVWPVTLPQLPMDSGYSESTSDTSIRTSMDVGPAKVRRRISAGVRNHQMQFFMTSTQLSDFITFYETTLLNGSLSYTWDHPRTSTNYSWRIKKAPTWSKQGEYYVVPLELEQLP